MATAASEVTGESDFPNTEIDWRRVAYLLHLSRALDDTEVNELLPARKLFYQFSARGHDMAQIILGTLLDHQHDAANGYYRSRPLMLSIGLDPEEALACPMMRAGGFSDGRDIGVVFNYPNKNGTSVLPMCGGVGAQYTPTVGWAQAVDYRSRVLGEDEWNGALGVALGGDASCATNGFWSALTIATTLKLPMLFYIEDNGYGISVTSDKQTPGRNIAANLASFKNLKIHDGDGTEPEQAAALLGDAVAHIRSGEGPALVRLTVPRLSGHSAQDTQAYKDEELVKAEWARDPLPKLKAFMVPNVVSEQEWAEIEQRAADDVVKAKERALEQPLPNPDNICRYVFEETDDQGQAELPLMGGMAVDGYQSPRGSSVAETGGERMNMLTAIRRTLDFELANNKKVLVFGEDVGPKGGVHAATMGLQDKHGDEQVFDTSLSEEGIIGRCVGLAAAGLMPVPEIQFRKYADPAEEQLNDIGTMRWRTNNRFACPTVVRIPGGFFKCGDPWHSQTNEVKWVHAIGWQLAMPSNAEDAVGLLRTAMRSNNPTIFFEHRAMLDDVWARRPYPGDDYVVEFGKGRKVSEGDDLTIVCWGAMVPRCQQAAKQCGINADVIDLRTLVPWDRDMVLESMARTHRCLIVHEDNLSAGFGAEIAAVLSDEAFWNLDAPIKRLAMPDVASPHSPLLLDAVVPNVDRIAATIVDLMEI